MKSRSIIILFLFVSICGMQGEAIFDAALAEDKHQKAFFLATNVAFLAVINVLQMKIQDNVDFNKTFFGKDERGRGFLKRLLNDKETVIATLRVASSVLFPLLAFYAERKAWKNVEDARRKARQSPHVPSELKENWANDKEKIKHLRSKLEAKLEEKCMRLDMLRKKASE